MRIFKHVFGGLLVALVLGLLGWFGREKIILAVASYQLRNDLASLKKLAYKNDSVSGCNSSLGYQLRFISETEYVIEPICVSIEVESINKNKLIAGARRLYGSGVKIELVDGIPILKDGWVHLTYGHSQTVVGLFDGVPKVVWDGENLGIGGDSPAQASCRDWGFSCCVSGVEVGELSKVRTADCINSCYQRCNRMPVVLFFNTDPVMNQKTRETLVSISNPVVRFGYELSDDEENAEVVIDFGDGQKSGKLPAKQSDLEHEYKCREGNCVYEVVMEGQDRSGNGLVKSELSRMRIMVR